MIKPKNNINRREGKLSDAQDFVCELSRNGNLSEETLVRLLRSGQIPEFVVVFSHRSDLNLITARRILQDNDAQSLAMVCRVKEFNKEAFSTLESLVCGDSKRSSKQATAEQVVFDRIDTRAASKAVVIWRHGPDSNTPTGERPPRKTDDQSARYINLSGQKLNQLED